MSAQIRNLRNVGRFASLLDGDVCSRPLYDHILFEALGCVVAPTLGSILPNWLLVVPRAPVLNFAQWETERGYGAWDTIRAVLSHDLAKPQRVIWFEHGPASAGSITGCGVDHAHLHVLLDPPFSFEEFSAAANERSDLSWRKSDPKTVHSSVEPQTSYLVAGSTKQACFAEGVERVGSQFFRRVVADLIGQPEIWNYAVHPHLKNVRQTVSRFERAKRG